MNKEPLTLAIETSCDETSVAVTRGFTVLSNAIHSQIAAHKDFGGVVPGIAKLEHEKKFPEVLSQALSDARVNLGQIEQIAVTKGPGLAIALEVGIKRAIELATELKLPLVAVNHMAGHLFSCFVDEQDARPSFPALGLLVSGKHSEFLLVEDWSSVSKLGQTLDDACGEAYDKCATMLGLSYPGGPVISRLAAEGRDQDLLELEIKREQQSLFVIGNAEGTTLKLPIPMAFSGDLNVSYSGLKTAIKQMINDLSGESKKLDIKQTGQGVNLSDTQQRQVCMMFEEAALQMLILKLERALDKHPDAKEVWVGGGVIANSYLKQLLTEVTDRRDIVLRIPSSRAFTGDNAAMIGVAAYASGRGGEDGSASSPQGGGKNLIEVYQVGELEEVDRLPGWSL
ncbi:tRNA (adenosine(37)-N6)-threonylcarbamoyltransferase complex transferase subunit TsaD [Candidatus Dojkabacteria bacterium]|uniref:tRNA N6-adenosine threonylcarbamoyltransferase n=1 Tax=Candidatus Dojkabacteria bacterium TaxID=2099670 RepID=A0A955ICQ2_9BACT|nr:tRNA (adenosine(37)-N6)-threonylcarbamoyltransferase complex transferase subunit TsaD [Candidatus Dojkabacteria bacterium]